MNSQLPAWPSVPHYYGDVVRIIFVFTAVAVGILAPMSGSVGFGLVIAMPIVLTLIVLAGFTNPHSKTVMILDTAAAAVCLMIAETFAIAAFQSQEMLVFLVFETIACAQLVALYFSAKTVRAALMGKIGKIDGVGEFDDDK
jgi:hypothetical protein